MKTYGIDKYGAVTDINNWNSYYIRLTFFPLGITIMSNDLVGSGIEFTFWRLNIKVCLRIGKF